MIKLLHLVDGTFELFRAHYAPRPGHFAPDGRTAKAAVGVVRSILRMLQGEFEQATLWGLKTHPHPAEGDPLPHIQLTLRPS